MGIQSDLGYDPRDAKSIERYAEQLENKTFYEVVENKSNIPSDAVQAYANRLRKGGLGNLLEEVYFGYKANSDQEADFKEAGVELKTTPYEVTKKGELRAGERLVLTMINYDGPVENDFYQSHLWNKMRLILLIYYWRNKLLNDNLQYKIGYVRLFTPPEADLKIIRDDYSYIVNKIQAGKAHELSEADTLYLGACTKGASAEKSTVPQYYGDKTPAMKRAFCFKNSYMTYVLNHYIVPSKDKDESIAGGVVDSFEDYVIDKIEAFAGYSARSLCMKYDIDYDKKDKSKWAALAYRILGIKNNKAAEFEKANIVVKTIRIEKNNRIKENMSFPSFKFKELIKEEWDDSTFGNYLRETKFLFVVYKYDENDELTLRGAQFWNIPYHDLEVEVRSVWERTVQVLKEGLKFEKVNGKYKNNFPKPSENRVSHVRPHGQDSKDTYELPDGREYPKQCFWLNNTYIYEQIDDRLKR